MIQGFDCYNTPSSEVLKRAVAAGFKVCLQYYGPSNSPKVTTAAEVARIFNAGLDCFMVFERNEHRAIQGMSAGRQDGELALGQAQVAGQPKGTCIAFAVDYSYDPANAQIANGIKDYFTGVKDKIVPAGYRMGVYGPGAVIDFLTTAGLVEIGWLAGALGWPGSRAYLATNKWHIRQYPTTPAANGPLGIDYDKNDIRDDIDIGIWKRPTTEPSPEPKPDPVVGSRTGPVDIFALQEALAKEGFYKDSIDGLAGNMTADALIAYSKAHPPVK